MNSNSRRETREYVFTFLYHLIFSNDSSQIETLAKQKAIEEEIENFQVNLPTINQEQKKFAYELIQTLAKNFSKIHSEIEGKLVNWKIERVNKIDLTLIALAYCEFAYLQNKTPLAVAINEYIELSKKFGTEESPKFINGILEKLNGN
jgi:N utilization substance protein B